MSPQLTELLRGVRVQCMEVKDSLQDLIQRWKQRLKVFAEDAEVVQKALSEFFDIFQREDQFTEPREAREQIFKAHWHDQVIEKPNVAKYEGRVFARVWRDGHVPKALRDVLFAEERRISQLLENILDYWERHLPVLASSSLCTSDLKTKIRDNRQAPLGLGTKKAGAAQSK